LLVVVMVGGRGAVDMEYRAHTCPHTHTKRKTDRAEWSGVEWSGGVHSRVRCGNGVKARSMEKVARRK
jgi:hypothetical protein